MKSNLFTLIILIAMITESKAQQSKSTVILVHGAGHGAWCWSKVIPLMQEKKINTLAIDLPGRSNDTAKLFTHTFMDDAEAVKNLANSVKGKVILVGHSSAGVAIAQASELLGKEKVEKLIFLDAFMPKNGESVLNLVEKVTKNNNAPNTTDAPPRMLFTQNFKVFQWNPATVDEFFYHDCKKEDIAFAKENLTWQSAASVGTPAQLSDSVYGSIPKYYILCTEAKEVNKSSIANNVPVEKVFSLSSSHSPFFSMPQKLVHVFQKIYKQKT
jgi:pimeloyl-ACP methyl ester carboxylesterase